MRVRASVMPRGRQGPRASCAAPIERSSVVAAGGLVQVRSCPQHVSPTGSWFAANTSSSQQKVLNRLFEDFEGKLTTQKWAAIAKTSPGTALRDLNALVEAGMLARATAGGRSSAYEIPAEFRRAQAAAGNSTSMAR